MVKNAESLEYCDICGSTDWKIVNEEKYVRHIRCANCNLLYDLLNNPSSEVNIDAEEKANS